ncbi:MAG: branched-chain amino acid ABC transporter permease [Firmicutes bacterium]|jgi:branched-chain amino acid transport system permease protein|nr:branched-chain amino acid ABC transporter permease [Bacillota bacterium]
MNNIKVFWNRYGLLVVAVLLLLTPQFTSQYEFYVVQRGVQNAMLVLGLVMLIGYTGLMTLGSAALLATGAYTYGILMLRLGCSPLIGTIGAVLFTTVVGTLLGIPAFRLSGPFLVVTTVGFGEIVRILILNWEPLTRGPYGLSGFRPVMPTTRGVYYLMVVVLILLAIVTERIGRSRLGLAMKAVKEDEVAAEVMGVNVRRVKLVSNALTAALAGLSGVFLASLTGYLNPDSFTSNESTSYLLMVVMGGMSNVVGSIISSLFLTVLPEVLRFLAESRLLVYSLILLVYLRLYHVRGSSKVRAKSAGSRGRS